MEKVWDAVRDPVRRAILDALMEGPLPAGEIARRFPKISRPAVSQHLAVLREAGLVSEHREGRLRIYTLQPDRLQTLWTEWLSHYQRFWHRNLETLKAVVERDQAADTVLSPERRDVRHDH